MKDDDAITANVDDVVAVVAACDVALVGFAVDYADVVAFAIDTNVVAIVVVAALYGVALVWFATSADVDVDAMVLMPLLRVFLLFMLNLMLPMIRV